MNQHDIVWLVIFFMIAMQGIAALTWNRLEQKTIDVLRNFRGVQYAPLRIIWVTLLSYSAMLLGQPSAGFVSSWSLPLLIEDHRVLARFFA